MEERIIEDENGRKIRYRKTAEGYVDVTDELAKDVDGEDAEEIEFDFPMTDADEDDEDLVGLSFEEAQALKKQKAEAVERRRKEYEQALKEGEVLLEQGSFHSAELKFEQALDLDEEATDASVGYWRAKTENFAKSDVLIDEYLEAGIESLEYDLGYKATDIIRERYEEVFKTRISELEAEETPLAKEVEEKQSLRREYLHERRKKARLAFLCSAIPMLACLVVAIIIGLKNFSTPDNRFVAPTVALFALFAVLFAVFAVFTNKFINARRMYRANERLSSTEEGERLLEIREYKELYACMLPIEPTEE